MFWREKGQVSLCDLRTSPASTIRKVSSESRRNPTYRLDRPRRYELGLEVEGVLGRGGVGAAVGEPVVGGHDEGGIGGGWAQRRRVVRGEKGGGAAARGGGEQVPVGVVVVVIVVVGVLVVVIVVSISPLIAISALVVVVVVAHKLERQARS